MFFGGLLIFKFDRAKLLFLKIDMRPVLEFDIKYQTALKLAYEL